MSTQTDIAVPVSSSAWIHYVHDAFHEVFGVMLGMKVTPCEGQIMVPELTAIVGLAGSICGLFSIRCNQENGCKFAERMLGAPGDEDETLDALGEICNMLAGSFKSRIPGIADTCMLSVPTTIAGADYHVHALRGGQRFEMQMECDGNLMQVILHLNQ
jgi:chemotaxis protein CheX